ncbi:MAG TPA: glycosyltransferase family 4 protein [Thermomicrobiales bacterium]|nr:glycosyltransferase family 4 protein [Thermomicrobiales bacterium]
MRSEVKELSSAATAAGCARSLFFVEYGMGHKTHLRFLEEHLDRDPRFDATLIRLYWMDDLAEWLGRFHLLPFRNAGLDFWTWWIFQFKRQQVRYLLRRYDPDNLDLVYIHTQTAATSVLDLPKHVPTVVSIDLTWKLAFQESRYHVSPLLKPVLELERRIFERADLVISFSDWAASSVIDDYGIPASKIKVVRNGVTLPPPLTGLRGGNGHLPNGHGGANGHSSGHSPNGRYLRPLDLGANGHGANGHGALASANGSNGHAASGSNGHGALNTGHQDQGGLLKLGFIGNGFLRKGGDLLLKVHQEHFADLAHLTLVTHDAPKGLSGLRNVEIKTEVPWVELMTSVLPGFDLFVFPTRFDYSPYAVIEAMSAGVPVISTRVGAIPEMVEDGVGGFLIEAGSAAPLAERVSWAIDNRAQLPAMGERGRERAIEYYAAERNYPQLLDTLAEVVQKPVLAGDRTMGS